MTILLFGITRDIVGHGTLDIPEADAETIHTVGELKARLVADFPELKRLSSLAVAVNQTYAGDTVPVGEKDEIALIPPVSGG